MPYTLLDHVQKKFPQNSKSSIRKWIRQGRISLDEKVVLHEMTAVSLESNIKLLQKKIQRFPFEVLFEDSDLIVVCKPINLLSVASLDPKEKNVHQYLKQDLKIKVYPVHRLDREVYGPLIFAKNLKTFELLKQAFYEKAVKREYQALIHGSLPCKEGMWESYLKEQKNYYVDVDETASSGQYAKTFYRVIEENSEVSLISLRLGTGRKNQLRVHCQKAHCPILGDRKYGIEDGVKQLALFAKQLEFEHPINKKKMLFQVEAPTFFQTLLKKNQWEI